MESYRGRTGDSVSSACGCGVWPVRQQVVCRSCPMSYVLWRRGRVLKSWLYLVADLCTNNIALQSTRVRFGGSHSPRSAPTTWYVCHDTSWRFIARRWPQRPPRLLSLPHGWHTSHDTVAAGPGGGHHPNRCSERRVIRGGLGVSFFWNNRKYLKQNGCLRQKRIVPSYEIITIINIITIIMRFNKKKKNIVIGTHHY